MALVLDMNLSNQAVTQYSNFDFDAVCVDDQNNVLAGNGNGLFYLEREDSDEAQIDAFFLLPLTDFGNENQKRIRSFLIGGETDGELLVSIATDEDLERFFDVVFDKDSLAQSGAKGFGVRSQKGRYWQFKIQNVDGSDFSIDELSVTPVILHTKPGRR